MTNDTSNDTSNGTTICNSKVYTASPSNSNGNSNGSGSGSSNGNSKGKSNGDSNDNGNGDSNDNSNDNSNGSSNGNSNGSSNDYTPSYGIGNLTEYLIDVKTLTKLCDLGVSEAAHLGAFLTERYKSLNEKQIRRMTAAEKIIDEVETMKEGHNVFDNNVVNHYDRFVRELEAAETAMYDGHKVAMYIDATKSAKLARENSEFARNLHKKIEGLDAEYKAKKDEIVSARDEMIDILYGAVMRCILVGSGAVESENDKGKLLSLFKR